MRFRFISHHSVYSNWRDHFIVNLKSCKFSQLFVILDVFASIGEVVLKSSIIMVTTPNFVKVNSLELSLTLKLLKLEVDFLSL